jgi:hypothetical protein
MDLIESLDPAGFAAYLKKLGNTICGRHPIGENTALCVGHFYTNQLYKKGLKRP